MDPHARLSKPVHPSLRYQVLQHTSETNASSPMRQAPPRESPAGLYQVNSRGNFYSSPTTDGFRGRSPPRELHPPSSFRPVDASRAGRFPRNGMVGSSQPTDSFIFTMKAAPQAARPIAQFAPATGGMQRSSQMVLPCGNCTILASFLGNLVVYCYFKFDEFISVVVQVDDTLTVAELLHTLGLRKYAIIFQAEEVSYLAKLDFPFKFAFLNLDDDYRLSLSDFRHSI